MAAIRLSGLLENVAKPPKCNVSASPKNKTASIPQISMYVKLSAARWTVPATAIRSAGRLFSVF